MAEDSKWPNLDEVYSLSQDALAAQLSQVSALDSKANFVLTSASVLTVAAVALHGALTPSSSSPTPASTQSPHALVVIGNILALLAVLAYIAVVISAYQAYALRTYRGVADPRVLKQKYVDMEPELAKATVFVTMVESYSQNVTTISGKVNWTRWAVRSLIVEGALVATITLVQLFL